ncbi:MAG: nitroreductase family protein [Verrucomicrobiae bacterium]|nr:nitroreductase family protein [Verrucomicrobiae bacterium]
MDILEAIRTRRSIRKFEDRAVPRETLERVLRAAMAAPSAKDEQPWRFIAVTDRATVRKVAAFHPGAEAAKQATAGVLVCHDPALEQIEGYWVQDHAAATQNILLSAHALGLGACWIGGHPIVAFEKGFRELFGLPESLVPVAFVAMGYPAETLPARDTYRAERVSWVG